MRPDEPGHRVPGGRQHALHDVLAPLMQRNLYQRARSKPLDHPELVGARHAVLQFDPAHELPAKITRYRAGNLGQVGLRHPEPGMGQPVSQLAVVHQQDQAFGVVVETTDVIQAFSHIAEQVGHRGPAAAVRHAGEHADRLVQGHVDQVLAGGDAPAIHADHLVLRVDPGSVPADDFAVDLDAAFPDQFLAVPAAADASRGEYLLQPDAAGADDERVALAFAFVLVTPVIVIDIVGRRAHALCRGGLRPRTAWSPAARASAARASAARAPRATGRAHCPGPVRPPGGPAGTPPGQAGRTAGAGRAVPGSNSSSGTAS